MHKVSETLIPFTNGLFVQVFFIPITKRFWPFVDVLKVATQLKCLRAGAICNDTIFLEAWKQINRRHISQFLGRTISCILDLLLVAAKGDWQVQFYCEKGVCTV